LYRLKKIKESEIIKKLDLLKNSYEENAREIGELENALKIDREIELQERARNVKVLEVLNSESVTPNY
jgi:hypothetical protein